MLGTMVVYWVAFYLFLGLPLTLALKYGSAAIDRVLEGLDWFLKAQAVNPGLRARGMAAALILGALLYEFRKRARLIYGITEVYFSTLVLSYALDTTKDATSAAFALAGGLYVYVRGRDNSDQGAKEWAQKGVRLGLLPRLDAIKDQLLVAMVKSVRARRAR